MEMKESFPEHYSVLLYGPPGVGKFEYCLDLANYYLEKGEKVVYMTTERSPQEILTRAASLGMDLAKYEESSFVFVDAFSWSVGEEYDKGFSISNPANLNQVIFSIEKAVTKLGAPVKIIFDSLSPLFLHNPAEALTKAFQLLASRAKTEYGFLLATLQDGVHDPQMVNTMIYLVDGYLEMKFEEEDSLERKLRVHHLKGLESDPSWLTFEITKEGFRFK